MYQAKTAGFLELLMNALTSPVSRRPHAVRHARPAPTRRESAVEVSTREAAVGKETYIAAARVLWWNR